MTLDNINIRSFKVVTTKNSNGNLLPHSYIHGTSTSSDLLHKLYYDSSPHTVRVLVIVKCVFDGPGFGNINNINQIALYIFVSSRGRERSSFFCSLNRYLQYNTGMKNTRASSLIWCHTCHPNPIIRPYDVTVVEQCSYAKTSSREPSIFIAHIVF